MANNFLCIFKVSLSDFLTLFSCRTQEGFFWTVPPGKPLMVAVIISLGISTGLASAWPKGHLDGLPVMGLVLGDYTVYSHPPYTTRVFEFNVHNVCTMHSSRVMQGSYLHLFFFYFSTASSSLGMDLLHHLVVHSGYFEGDDTLGS